MTFPAPNLVAHSLSGLVPEMTDDEYRLLLADIHEHGLHTPITLFDSQILDGRHRYRALYDLAEQRGVVIPPRFTAFEGTESAAASYVISLNIHRRHLTAGQRAMIAVPLLETIQQTVKAGRPPNGNSGNIAGITSAERESRSIAAAAVNVSPRSVQAAVKLEKESPILAEQVRNGNMELWQAEKEHKADVKQQRIAQTLEKLAAEPLPPPEGPFRVIAIDPPWEYEKRPDDPEHRAANPYPSMSIEQIAALPIAGFAAEDCILWLWTTNAHMREAFALLDVWGFQHKTILTWVKDRMGLGDWLRGRTEHCLMAVRGHPVVTLTNQTTAITGPMREHSRKPDSFYAMVDGLCPGSKLDMFGREQKEGWQVWGAETDRF